jgi:hypothetical protein
MSREMTTAGFVVAERHRWVTNLAIVALGLMLFAALNARSGRVEANDGLGWDGRQYAHMVTGRVQDGTVATQTRPLLPLLTRIPYYAGLDVVTAFQVMNFVYAAVLTALSVCSSISMASPRCIRRTSSPQSRCASPHRRCSSFTLP